MIRQFVNLVVENYKTGVYSLHRLDVYKHLFHQSRADARVVPPLLAEDHRSAGGDEQPVLDRLKHLPPAIAAWSSSNVDHLSLLGSRGNEEGRILCLNKVGAAVVYDPHSDSNFIMPRLDKFNGGPVPLSLSIADKEEKLYMMHAGPDGLEWNFSVLGYWPWFRRPWSGIKGWYWYWQPLPVPPFVKGPQFKPAAGISAYTVVDGGSSICLSSGSGAEGVGRTYYFNTVSCEWKRAAGDWVLPFTGKAEYISDLNLWLGFSLRSPGYLCAASDMLMDHKPMSLIVWPADHMPKEWMTVSAKLISLGSRKFAVARVFKAMSNTEDPTVENEVVVLSGAELDFRGKDNNKLQGLKLIQHKSICYTCANSTTIRCVL